MASLITLFRPWVVGPVRLVHLYSCTFAPHPSRWLHSLLSSLLAQLAGDPGICGKSRGSQVLTRIAGNHADQFSSLSQGRWWLACTWRAASGQDSLRQSGSPWQFSSFIRPKPSSCLAVRGAVADLALVPPFHLASVSGLLSLISRSASRYSGKCCLVSRFELGVGACVSLGGGTGSTSSLFAAPSPSKHPWVVFGWRPVCSAHGLWLKARCSPRNRRPLWQAPSPSSSIDDEFKCG